MPSVTFPATEIVAMKDVTPAIKLLRERYPEAKPYLRFRRDTIWRRLFVCGHGGWSAIQPRDTAKWRADPPDTLIDTVRYCYWSNLFNQVVYTFFRDYSKGKSLEKAVLFPEILGDCPGACRFHLEPLYALDSLFGVKLNRNELMQICPRVAADSKDWLQLVSGESEESLPDDIAARIMEKCIEYSHDHASDEGAGHEA